MYTLKDFFRLRNYININHESNESDSVLLFLILHLVSTLILDHLFQYCNDNNIVVETTAHLFADNGYTKLNNVVNSTSIENNPFYLGQKGIDDYLNNLSLEIDRAIANSIK